MLKKLPAITLLCILFLLTSCSQREVEDGFQEITSKVVDFSFTCPKSWEYIRNDAMIAVKSTSNNANISITSFEQAKATSVNEYFDSYQDNFLTTFKNMEILFDNEIKLDGIPARRITYSNELGDEKFKSDMVICIRNGVVYTITFTTIPDEYDESVLVFNSALESFIFK